MVNTLQRIELWVGSLILTVFAYVDEALAYWKQRLHDYADELETQNKVRVAHLPRECVRPDVCPYYGHLEFWQEAGKAGIGLHNKGARDEMEQVIHG